MRWSIVAALACTFGLVAAFPAVNQEATDDLIARDLGSSSDSFGTLEARRPQCDKKDTWWWGGYCKPCEHYGLKNSGKKSACGVCKIPEQKFRDGLGYCTCADRQEVKNGKCVDKKPAPKPCPHGAKRDYPEGHCYCIKEHQEIKGDKCVDKKPVPKPCPHGAKRDYPEGHCYCVKEHQEIKGDKCVDKKPTPKPCPHGAKRDHPYGECYCIDQHQELKDGKCVDKHWTCPRGQKPGHEWGSCVCKNEHQVKNHEGKCVDPPHCEDGAYWDYESSKCVGH